MQRCKSAYGLCKGGKVDTGRDSTACYPREIEATRLARSANPTRGRGRRFECRSANGRDAVAPLPEAARLARSANPTRYKVKRGRSERVYYGLYEGKWPLFIL
jgi:hypothetical protein